MHSPRIQTDTPARSTAQEDREEIEGLEARPSRSVLEKLGALKDHNSAVLHEEVRQRRSVYAALPEVVTLNHTDICNLRCVMCPRNLKQGTHRLAEDLLGHVAHQLFPTARKLVLTTSEGEPLGVDFHFLLRLALRYGVKIDAVTNGMLLTEDLYRVARHAFDHLNVSLDSHVPEIYERIRLGASHDRVFGNLKAIGAMRAAEPDDVLLSVSAVVMRSNLDHLSGFVEQAADLGVDGVILQRLLQDTKTTAEESLTPAFTPERVAAALDQAAETAARRGINLFTSEFGRPNVMVKPLRAKRPTTLEGHGTCWFLAQNFNVMYTGEVYPCCIPTDHLLGNVFYEDPVEIWNGQGFQRLRRAHLEGRGTTFCTGCIHAPHLPAKEDRAVGEPVRKARMATAHVQNEKRRHRLAQGRSKIFDPGQPGLIDRSSPVQDATHRTVTRPARGTVGAVAGRQPGQPAGPMEEPADALYHNLQTGETHGIGGGAIWIEPAAHPGRPTHRSTGQAQASRRIQVAATNAIGSALVPIPGGFLFSFEGEGWVYRLVGSDVQRVLQLSHPESFVRQGGGAVAADGSIWIGEYGVFPGARCARLYRSLDGGATFELVHHIREARHVHLVYADPDHGIIVTTGDLASERRLYTLRPEAPVLRQRRGIWSGFTAAASLPNGTHFGTDLAQGNGLLRFAADLDQPPEFHRLPPECDAPVRNLLTVDDRRLLAWCRVEDPEPDAPEVWGALLLSEDAGVTWQCVHRSVGSGREVAENVVLVSRDPIRVRTVMTSRLEVLEVR